MSLKRAESQVIWDPVQVFEFPSDTLEDCLSCVNSTCTVALRESYRESHNGSDAEALRQHYEKLAGARPADIRPVDLQVFRGAAREATEGLLRSGSWTHYEQRYIHVSRKESTAQNQYCSYFFLQDLLS